MKKINKKTLLNRLNTFKKKINNRKNTPYNSWCKLVSLVNLLTRYEKISISKKLKKHPYISLSKLIDDSEILFENLIESSFIEKSQKNLNKNFLHKEKLHEELFDNIWNRYNKKEFREYIKRYKKRIRINNLDIKGKTIVDLGCGNGVFCFALIEMGAKAVYGIDFGGKSISFAKKIARLNYKKKNIKFFRRTVYKTGFKTNKFDMAIQNGVYHHLSNEPKAIKEISRILKSGGKLWYYTAGSGDLANDLHDLAQQSTKNIPYNFKEYVFKSMGMSTNKLVYLMDGFTAIYRRTTFKKLSKLLSRYGFYNFKILKGGFKTDKDPLMIKNFDYGKERYGEGDLRLFCSLK